MDAERIIEIEDAHDSHQFNKKIPLLHGEGAILYGQDGTPFIDCAGAHGVATIGYAHPRFVEEMCAYLQDKRPITCGHYYDENRAEFIEKLLAVVPKNLNRVFFGNSGTEAVEAAFKFAMKYKKDIKDKEIVAFKRAFHGRTLGALAATFEPRYRDDYVFIPGVKHASYNDAESARSLVNENTIAIILELVQGEGGVYPANDDFPAALRELCDEKGIPLIFDEVQTGFGRTGKLFCLEHYGVQPDILCLAKGIAGGIPMGATITTDAIMDAVTPGSHGNTFGENPFACHAGIVSLDIIQQEHLIEHANKISEYLFPALHALAEQHPSTIKEIRGKGLMIGVQFRNKINEVMQALQDEGVLVLNAGVTVVRLLPPLVITMDQAKQVIEAFEKILDRE
jgi:acetylornithine/LysW-gamma-L-lysine aminotransferase